MARAWGQSWEMRGVPGLQSHENKDTTARRRILPRASKSEKTPRLEEVPGSPTAWFQVRP